MANEMWRVFAVDNKTGERRAIWRGEGEKNAEAVIRMAVMRRGVDAEHYVSEKEAPHAQP